MLSENMCFVWFKLSYSGQKIGCHKRENIRHTYIHVNIELESAKHDLQYSTNVNSQLSIFILFSINVLLNVPYEPNKTNVNCSCVTS